MIFQDSVGALNPKRPIGKVIARAASITGLGGDASRRTALRMLELVGLPQQAFGRRPHELSGGHRQRINIARALAMKPRLLIVDESLSGLDVLVQAQAQIGDYIAVMKHGKIVETGPIEQVFQRPRSTYTKELVAAIPGKEFFKAHCS